jgi:long-chain acyl-CoA synthetase
MSADIEPPVCSLLRLATDAGDRAGLWDRSREFTLTRCAAAIRGGASWLLDLGLRSGDRVALFGENSVTFALAYFAVHAAGGITVPIGADVSADDVRRSLEDCTPSLVLAEDPGRVPVTGARPLPPPEQWAAWRGVLTPRCSGETAADLLFTTGTTGRRKGVLLSQGNIASAATNINAFIGTSADDLEVVPIPLTHSFGLGRLRCWARIAHHVVLESGLRNPALVFKRLLDTKATGLAIVPAGVALIRRLVGARFAALGAHLRYVELGSAPLSREDRRFLIATLPTTRICHHYGLTEASRAAFAELHRDSAKPSSIGRPAPNVEIRVGDEHGRSLPPTQVGELLVRGGMVMQGYWQQPELTRTTFLDGWLRTGDEGWMDDDGDLFLRGRQGDIINVGGLKVAPYEIEQRLCEIPGVRDAACIGAPDPRGVLGQVVKAFVVSDVDPSELDIAERLRRCLPEHELPRLFERVAALPKTESGKLKRAELRAREIS